MKNDLHAWLKLLDLCLFQPAERVLARLIQLVERAFEACPMELGRFCAVVISWLAGSLLVAKVSGFGAFLMLSLLAIFLFVAARRLP